MSDKLKFVVHVFSIILYYEGICLLIMVYFAYVDTVCK